MKILINILGIITFFWVRFTNRTDKTAEPSLKFWLKDNYEQLVCIGLIDIALMLLVFQGGLKVSFEKLPGLPDWIQLIGDGAMYYLVGLVFSYFAYEAYKKLVIDKR
jgi:hypothetical protein